MSNLAVTRFSIFLSSFFVVSIISGVHFLIFLFGGSGVECHAYGCVLSLANHLKISFVIVSLQMAWKLFKWLK